MLASFSKLPLILRVLVGLIFLITLFFCWRYFFGARYFPPLPRGSYVGVIEDFPISERVNKDVSLFVERFADSRIAMVVIFVEGWTPKSINLRALPADETLAAQNFDSARLNPIEFIHEGLQYSMYGEMEDGRVVGKLKEGNSLPRKFNLESLPDSRLAGTNYGKDVTRVDMENWVKLRSEYIELRSQLADGEEEKEQKDETFRKLTHFMNNKGRLKSVADKERARLEGELDNLRASSGSREASLKSLVRELEVLGRITERGKTIRLIRRINNRENKWYLANWRDEIDRSVLPSNLRNDPSINLSSIEEDYQAAIKVRKLKRILRKERLAVKYLSDEYQRKLAPVKETLPQKPQEKSLWERLTE